MCAPEPEHRGERGRWPWFGGQGVWCVSFGVNNGSRDFGGRAFASPASGGRRPGNWDLNFGVWAGGIGIGSWKGRVRNIESNRREPFLAVPSCTTVMFRASPTWTIKSTRVAGCRRWARGPQPARVPPQDDEAVIVGIGNHVLLKRRATVMGTGPKQLVDSSLSYKPRPAHPLEERPLNMLL